ncbi:MAG TPA: MFS transporter [Porticoccus sp.]|nr:MFS transporter [Porticoccus sp.]
MPKSSTVPSWIPACAGMTGLSKYHSCIEPFFNTLINNVIWQIFMSTASEQQDLNPGRNQLQTWAHFALLTAITVLLSTELTIINSLIPEIVISLNLSLDNASMASAIYMIVAGALMIPMGILGDKLGASRMIALGTLFFISGCATAGFADTAFDLILGRVLQGIAFAIILPASFASLNRGFPSGSQRTLAFGLFTSLVGSAAGFGSLLGALVAEYGSWRSVFTYLIPPFLVLTILYVSLAPKSTRQLSDSGQKGFDIPGAILLFVCLALLIFAIQQAPSQGLLWSKANSYFLGKAWNSPVSVTPYLLLSSAVMGLLLVTNQRLRERKGLAVIINYELFHIPNFIRGTNAFSLMMAAYFTVILLSAIYARYLMGETRLGAGAIIAMIGLGILLTSPITARLNSISRVHQLVICTALQLMTTMGLILSFENQATAAIIQGLLFLQGMTWSVSYAAASSLLLAMVPPVMSGAAVGLQSAHRYITIGLALALTTSLMINVSSWQAQDVDFSHLTEAHRMTLLLDYQFKHPAQQEAVPEHLSTAKNFEIQSFNHELEHVQEAMRNGINAGLLLCCGFITVALVSNLTLRERKQAA